jgi:cytidine deaminase
MDPGGGRMRKADWDALLDAAAKARSHAHAPYSGYKVGAALLTKGGHLFAGCNVENATYGATICAERAAVTAMVAAGEKEPVACVVLTRGPSPAAPCGICRQVLSEFADDMPILLAAVDGKGRVVAKERARLQELLPRAFRLR